MDDDGVLSVYVTMLDTDLALEGRAVVSRADDACAVGAVATRETLQRLEDVYRARGFRVSVDPDTAALEIRRR
jgi:hypothetical protein